MLISWRVHLTVKENMNVSLGVFCEWDLLQVSINRMCPSPQGYGAYLHGLLWFHLVYCSIQFWWGRKVVNIKKPWSHKGVFPEIVGFPPKSSIFHWGFPLFSPSILGVPLFLETPIVIVSIICWYLFFFWGPLTGLCSFLSKCSTDLSRFSGGSVLDKLGQQGNDHFPYCNDKQMNNKVGV